MCFPPRNLDSLQHVLSHCPHADALCLLRVCAPLAVLTQHYTHLQPGATFDNVDIVTDVKQVRFFKLLFRRKNKNANVMELSEF